MHGEAWVNTSIQEADLLIAFGMRFDDRVTGNLETYARHARKIHVGDRSVGDQQDRQGRRAAGRRSARDDLRPAPAGETARSTGAGSTGSRSSRGTPRCATSSHCPTTGGSSLRTSSTISGASPTARRWSSPTWASTRCGRRSTTSTTTRGSCITSGGLGTMGFALPCGHRRAVRPARRRDLGDRRRRRLPDDQRRAHHLRAGGPEGQRRDHQQRLPRHGPPVAAVLLRRPLHAPRRSRARTS